MKELDIEVQQHSGPKLGFAIVTLNSQGVEVATDLTGYTGIQFILKTDFTDADPAPLYAGTISNGPGGLVEVDTLTSNHLTPGIAWYRLQGTNPAGKVTTLAEGHYIVIRN